MREPHLESNNEHMSSAERDIEKVLRPSDFGDFTGQDAVVENLRIFVRAAVQRGEALDHVLLHG
ncbi:MAG: Holliday junction branch migration DNA helicase RuvB, partial [Bacteroidota bacterium]